MSNLQVRRTSGGPACFGRPEATSPLRGRGPTERAWEENPPCRRPLSLPQVSLASFEPQTEDNVAPRLLSSLSLDLLCPPPPAASSPSFPPRRSGSDRPGCERPATVQITLCVWPVGGCCCCFLFGLGKVNETQAVSDRIMHISQFIYSINHLM